jgi:zinc protease
MPAPVTNGAPLSQGEMHRMPKDITQARLDNGLQVILKESHVAPVVSTWMWYRVGSRNEVEGHTGLSHWVEHMLFKGTKRFPKGTIMRSIDRLGGYVNAMTSHDYTAYYATLPSDRAELALEIEADRMRNALFDPTEVEAERTVIISEREGSENEPHFVLSEEMTATAFRVHPYHHQVIGWKEDLVALTRDQLYAHYQSYYAPNNAVLIVAGDLDPRRYLERVRELFGTIPTGSLPAATVRPEPPARGERRVTVHMPGSAPSVRISYPAPPVSHPDYMPVVVLDALLSGGKAMFAFGGSAARSARLYRGLVETQLASTASSSFHPSLDPYLLTLSATVREGRDIEEVETALGQEAERLRRELAQTHELQVAVRQTQAQFAYSSESVTSQALTLGFLEMVDSHRRMPNILSELAAVTPEDVLRVAQTYLTPEQCVVGHFMPTEMADEQDMISEAQAHHLLCEPLCFLTGSSHATLSPETVFRQELDNGMVVLIKENLASETVTVQADMDSGGIKEQAGQEGLATVTASMLRRGTAQHTYQQLNEILDNVGAEIGFSAGRDDMGLDGDALAGDFELLMAHLAEIVMMPTFPQEELAKLKGQFLTHLTMLHSDTGFRADEAFMATLYPDGHPYGRPSIGTRESLSALTQEGLLRFYAQHYRPDAMVISVVGAVEISRVMDCLHRTLGQWRVAGARIPSVVPPAPSLETIQKIYVPIPGKAQADLILGVVGMPRTSPDYYPAMIANLVLGRLGLMGRLGERVRDEQGLAYYVSSNLQTSKGPHPWSVSAGVNPANIDKAIASILSELDRLRAEPISQEELDDCRSYLTGALPLRLETNDGIASYLLNLEEYDLGLDYLQRYPQIIGAVAAEDIQRVVQTYLTTDRYVFSAAGTFS